MKYKVGDKVRVKNDTRIRKYYKNLPFFDERQNIFGEIVIIVLAEDLYKINKGERRLFWHEEDFEPAEKTLLTLEANDIVIDSDGDKRKILAVLYQDEERALYSMSEIENYDYYFAGYTNKDLERDGFKPFIEKKETILELTLDEVAEKYGADKVKIVKKKD